jgi:hypothetical protein
MVATMNVVMLIEKWHSTKPNKKPPMSTRRQWRYRSLQFALAQLNYFLITHVDVNLGSAGLQRARGPRSNSLQTKDQKIDM